MNCAPTATDQRLVRMGRSLSTTELPRVAMRKFCSVASFDQTRSSAMPRPARPSAVPAQAPMGKSLPSRLTPVMFTSIKVQGKLKLRMAYAEDLILSGEALIERRNTMNTHNTDISLLAVIAQQLGKRGG